MKFGTDQELTPGHPCTKFQIDQINRLPVADRQNHRAGVKGKKRAMARSSARDRADRHRESRKGREPLSRAGNEPLNAVYRGKEGKKEGHGSILGARPRWSTPDAEERAMAGLEGGKGPLDDSSARGREGKISGIDREHLPRSSRSRTMPTGNSAALEEK